MADAGAPEVGAQGGQNQRQKLAQHAVFGQVGDACQGLIDCVDLRRRALLVALGRRQSQPEQAHQHACDVRVGGQRALDRGLRRRKADLLQVLGIGAQNDDVVGLQAGQQHQPVEVVVFDLATKHFRKRVLEQAGQPGRIDGL